MELIDLTEILLAAITLIFLIITKLVAPLIKAKISAADYEKLCSVVWIGVKAAEQLYKIGKVHDRKQYVLAYLMEQGYDIDTEEVENLIEAYVQEINATQGNQ